jgi:hypothetical protein
VFYLLLLHTDLVFRSLCDSCGGVFCVPLVTDGGSCLLWLAAIRVTLFSLALSFQSLVMHCFSGIMPISENGLHITSEN